MRDRASILITAGDATRAAFDAIHANLMRMAVDANAGGKAMVAMGAAAGQGAAQVGSGIARTHSDLATAVSGFVTAKKAMQSLAQATKEATGKVAQAAAALARDPGSKSLQRNFEAMRENARAVKQEFAGAQLTAERFRRSLASSGIKTGDLNYGLAGAEADQQRAEAAARQRQKLSHARDLLDVRPWRDIQREIDQTQAAFVRLKSSGALSAGELGQAWAHAQGRIAELRAQTNGIAAHFSTVRESLAGLIASAAGFTLAAREAISFESAMTGVRRVANTTAEETAVLAEGVRRLAISTGQSATEIAGMTKAAASAGIAKEDLLQFTEQAIKAAVAFDMLPSDAGTAVAKLQGIFKIPLNEIDAFSGAINLMADNAKTSEKDIVETLVRGAGSAGQQFGLLREQTVALATSILDMGVAPEVAGTAMRTLLDGLRHAIVDTGDAGAGLRSLGISASEFGGRLSTDAAGALTQFLGKLADLDSLTRRRILEKIFGSGLDTSMIEQLAGNLGTVDRMMGYAATDAALFKKALYEVFALKMGETQTSLNRMWESIKALGDAVGQLLLPAIRLVTAGIAGMALALRTFVQEFPLLSSAIGVFITLASGAAALRLGFAALMAIGGRLVSLLGVGFSSLLAPIGAVTAWVGRLLAGFGVLAAFLAGWDIGSLLAQRFAVVRQFGVQLVAGLLMGFEMLRYGWESFATLFSSDTLEAASMRHQQRIDEMGRSLAQLYDDACKAAATAGKKQVASEQFAAGSVGAIRKELADKRAQLAQLSVDREKAILEQGASSEKDLIERRIADIRHSHEVFKKANEDSIADLKRYKEAARDAYADAAATRMSTADKVRALRRRDMDETGQQADMELEAIQKLKLARRQATVAAQKDATAAKSGKTEDFDAARRATELAKSLADQASSMGENLKNTQQAVRIVNAAGKLSANASTRLGNANAQAAQDAQERINTLGMSISTLEASLMALEQKKITLQIDTNIDAVMRQIEALEAKLDGLAGAKSAGAPATAPAQAPATTSGSLPGFRSGGFIPGYGGGDRILALLESGEFILRKEAVKKFGLGFLGALNAGFLQKFRTGGPVGAQHVLSGGQVSANERVDLFLHFNDGQAPARVTTPRDEARTLISRLGTLRFYGGVA